MITPQALRTMPQAASLGPQHRSDAMKKGVGDRLEVGQVERRQEEADELGESEQDLGARAAEDREQVGRLRGRGLRIQPSWVCGGAPSVECWRFRIPPDFGGNRRCVWNRSSPLGILC